MLEVKNLTFRVTDGGEATILDNLSFTVPSGQIIVITGPNGGGKSTLAKLIMGIEQPTSGQIFLDGQDITGLSITERARLGIGYAFQQPPRFKGVTVRRMLEMAHGSPLSEPECCGLLSRVGLCPHEYLKREVDASLSGGELKRIEIASLMARDVRLAIYDEPEAGIDLWSFSMLVDSFESFRTNPQQSALSSPTRNGSSAWPMKLSSSPGEKSPHKAARRKSSRFCKGKSKTVPAFKDRGGTANANHNAKPAENHRRPAGAQLRGL